MAYDFSTLKTKVADISEHLKKELSAIHTGRASVALLDVVTVESYGAWLPIPHLATITTEDARTIRIVPWDKTNSKAIEKAISEANLGVSASVDDQGLRIFFPELTTERRIAFTKIVRDRIEDARVTLKGEREKTKNDIIARERDGEMGEDDKERALEEMQKIVEDANTQFADLGAKKEAEILGN